jgi:hypothetical protein
MRDVSDYLFETATEGMSAGEVLNYYRNLYHAKPQSTEHGIVANALNDILPRMIATSCKAEDVVEVVRCKDCDVPHNRWTGCPNMNGMIPPPDFYCAKGERKQKADDVPDISVGDKQSCKVCEKITEANKDIFWVFARTHQPGTREEFLRIPYEDVRFCPVCGREITKEGKT